MGLIGMMISSVNVICIGMGNVIGVSMLVVMYIVIGKIRYLIV